MKDKHLQDGLNKLPKYTPDGEVWENIEGQLHLQEAIAKLREYEPSDALWERIDTEIRPKTRMRTMWQRTASVAAMLAITLGTYWWMTNEGVSEEIFYATAQMDTRLFEADWNEDEDGFEALTKLCSQKAFVCEVPEFKLLQSEFEELNDAKIEVETAMAKYGKQADFILQIKDIEQERSKVLKELFAMI